MGDATDPVPEEKKGKRRGPKPMKLSDPQMGKFLELLRSGIGRVMACERMEIDYKTFRRIVREDADFARWIHEAEKSRIEGCEAAIYRMATRSYDSPVVLRAALSYLGRREKIDEARRARRDKAEKAAAKLEK